MRVKEAIVLAGGKGTRLQGLVSDLPKPMALVNGRPFLEYVLDDLIAYKGLEHIVLSVGYLHHLISDYFGTQYKGIDLSYAIEEEPLGTGGAISLSLNQVVDERAFVVNGDTRFAIDLSLFEEKHRNLGADLSLALKPIAFSDRYGSVNIEGDRVVSFEEKKYVEEALINGGVYLLEKSALVANSLPKRFSFEKDILEAQVKELIIGGFVFDDYFIDIGIPEDYMRAQKEFARQ